MPSSSRNRCRGPQPAPEETRPVQGSSRRTDLPYTSQAAASWSASPVSTAAQVREAAAAARAAQKGWAAKSFKERGQCCRASSSCPRPRRRARQSDRPRERQDADEALFMEVLPVADLTHYFAASRAAAARRAGPAPHVPAQESYLRFYPRGVIGIISPWNYPFSIPAGDTVMALLAGNGVVLKPSEFTPLVAERLRAFLEEAGVPRGLSRWCKARAR